MALRDQSHSSGFIQNIFTAAAAVTSFQKVAWDQHAPTHHWCVYLGAPTHVERQPKPPFPDRSLSIFRMISGSWEISASILVFRCLSHDIAHKVWARTASMCAHYRSCSEAASLKRCADMPYTGPTHVARPNTIKHTYTWTCPSVADIQHFPSWLATHLRPMCSVTPLGGHVLNSESLASLSSLEQSDAESVCNCYRASRRQIKSSDWEFLAWRIHYLAQPVQLGSWRHTHCADCDGLGGSSSKGRSSPVCFCLLFNDHCFPLLQVSSLIWRKSAVR